MDRCKFDVKRELKKLEKIVALLPDELKQLTEGLVADAAFMAEQLEKLRQHIAEYGWSETYQNGANQSGKKSSVEADAYIKMQKSYAAIIKQLTDLLPDTSETTAGAEIMEFLNANG